MNRITTTKQRAAHQTWSDWISSNSVIDNNSLCLHQCDAISIKIFVWTKEKTIFFSPSFLCLGKRDPFYEHSSLSLSVDKQSSTRSNVIPLLFEFKFFLFFVQIHSNQSHHNGMAQHCMLSCSICYTVVFLLRRKKSCRSWSNEEPVQAVIFLLHTNTHTMLHCD